MDLKKIILSDPINKWLFSNDENDIFLVGGYIRDLLRGDFINRDKDYVLKNNVKDIAYVISNKYKGTLIELRKGETYRVVLKNRQSLDFSSMHSTISDDLSERDFRINAMAWSPGKGLIDPFNGNADLTNKIIRVINPENLAKDPLRILRAYRLAAQLGFTIDIDTRNYLIKYSSHIKESAAERITEELIKLLMAENSSLYISMSEKDNVLHKIINVTPHNIRLNMILLENFERFTSSLRISKSNKLFNSKISQLLEHNIGQMSIEGLLRLSILLNNSKGSIENDYGMLKFSNKIVLKLRNVQNGLVFSKGRITENKLYDLLNKANDCAFEVALLLSLTRQKSVDKFLKRADDFVKFKKKPLLDGYIIQNIFNIGPTELIGNIQAEIQKRRFLGIIRTKKEAIHWIMSNLT